MEITDVLQLSQVLVKELSEGLNVEQCSLEQVEGCILSFVYELAHTLEREVLAGQQEPTHENSLRESGSEPLCMRASGTCVSATVSV